jgi:hypothetical protein
LHIIDNTWIGLIIFFSKKTDMKFIILVSNLKEISPSVFSWKKEYIKNNEVRCNSTVKIRFGRKKTLSYAYVLKNGIGRYNIFFLFLHKVCWILLFVSFSGRIRQCFCLCHVHFLQQTISPMHKRFTEWVHCVGRMNVWILRG